jgi:hypothetical protein
MILAESAGSPRRARSAVEFAGVIPDPFDVEHDPSFRRAPLLHGL